MEIIKIRNLEFKIDELSTDVYSIETDGKLFPCIEQSVNYLIELSELCKKSKYLDKDEIDKLILTKPEILEAQEDFLKYSNSLCKFYSTIDYYQSDTLMKELYQIRYLNNKIIDNYTGEIKNNIPEESLKVICMLLWRIKKK